MGLLFAKQPNGKFCGLHGSSDAIEIWNMEEDELREELIKSRYIYFPEFKECEEILQEEIKNPKVDGRYLTTFDDLLTNLSLMNYETIDDVRNLLHELGYEKWQTFITWDYVNMIEQKKIIKEHFSEGMDFMKLYLKTYKIENKSYIQDVDNIQSYDDFMAVVKKYELENDYYYIVDEDGIFYDYYYAEENEKRVNDIINSQFEGLEYKEFV